MIDIQTKYKFRPVHFIFEYQKFRNTSACISDHYDAFVNQRNNKAAHRELMKASGFKDYNKFRSKIPVYNKLQTEIPLAYLECIGCTREVMDYVFNLDLQEFDQALEITRFPPRLAEIHSSSKGRYYIDLPEFHSEDEAISKLINQWDNLLKETNQSLKAVSIPYGDIRETVIYSPQKVIRVEHRPRLKYGKTLLFPYWRHE